MNAVRASFLLILAVGALWADSITERPFAGITHITRTGTSPRNVTMHIVQVDLNSPRIQFKVTAPGGALESVRQTTLGFLDQERAQVAVNLHFFLPFPSSDLNANLIGLTASNGNVYSGFEAPLQSYAIVANAPAINIDANNNASIVHADTNFTDGKHVAEDVALYNAFSGSAQIVTGGVSTVPEYKDEMHPEGLLTPGGAASYSNSFSWYNLFNSRTAIGLSEDNRTLTIFTVDNAGGSRGMSLGEVADVLIADYGVFNALNMDGGGSVTLAIQDAAAAAVRIANVSSDNPNGRAVASSLAIFVTPAPVEF